MAMKRELTWTHLQLRQKVNNMWYKLQDGDNNDDILCCRKNNFKQVTVVTDLQHHLMKVCGIV